MMLTRAQEVDLLVADAMAHQPPGVDPGRVALLRVQAQNLPDQTRTQLVARILQTMPAQTAQGLADADADAIAEARSPPPAAVPPPAEPPPLNPAVIGGGALAGGVAGLRLGMGAGPAGALGGAAIGAGLGGLAAAAANQALAPVIGQAAQGARSADVFPPPAQAPAQAPAPGGGTDFETLVQRQMQTFGLSRSDAEESLRKMAGLSTTRDVGMSLWGRTLANRGVTGDAPMTLGGMEGQLRAISQALVDVQLSDAPEPEKQAAFAIGSKYLTDTGTLTTQLRQLAHTQGADNASLQLRAAEFLYRQQKDAQEHNDKLSQQEFERRYQIAQATGFFQMDDGSQVMTPVLQGVLSTEASRQEAAAERRLNFGLGIERVRQDAATSLASAQMRGLELEQQARQADRAAILQSGGQLIQAGQGAGPEGAYFPDYEPGGFYDQLFRRAGISWQPVKITSGTPVPGGAELGRALHERILEYLAQHPGAAGSPGYPGPPGGGLAGINTGDIFSRFLGGESVGP